MPPPRTRRRPPLLLLAFLLIGAAVVYGGVSVYRDQQSGTAGKAKVTECTGGRKYQPAIRCRGTWIHGGSLLDGGSVVVGQRRGRRPTATSARRSTVRIHGTDHATKPSLAHAARAVGAGPAGRRAGALGARRLVAP